jgi:hypothetical protein
MVETPSAMPYPGNIVSARTARHRRHTSAKTGNPAMSLRSPARPISWRTAAGLLVIRALPSRRPSSVVRTSTLRRRCRSSRRPACRRSLPFGPPLPGGDGCLAPSSIRQERRPAPSSHQNGAPEGWPVCSTARHR